MRKGLLLTLLASVLTLALVVPGGRAEEPGKSFLTTDLKGWEGLNQYWTYKDGALVGSAPDGLKFNTFLCSKTRFKDFELKFQVRVKDGKGNSGVQIRSEVFDRDKFAVKGPQCDIGEGYWGSLYGEHTVGMMKAAPKEAVSKVLKPTEFNEYHIKAVGKKITIKLNGQTTVDQEFDVAPAEGIIAFQLHAGGPMEVTFKNIEFKDLSADLRSDK